MQVGLVVAILLMFLAYPPDTKLISRSGSVIVSKSPRNGAENILVFFDAKGERLCALDYSSADSRHGYAVIKAEWTRDQRYFVWSLNASSGHQPWHFPTLALDTKTNLILQLDDFLRGPGFSRGDFTLHQESTVESRQGKRKAVLNLRELSRKPPTGNEFHCGGGQTIHLDYRR